jgi:hypothetical protein
MGRSWEDSAGKNAKQRELKLVAGQTNRRSHHGLSKCANLRKSSTRTAKPPFIGSIPIGAFSIRTSQRVFRHEGPFAFHALAMLGFTDGRR